MKSRVNVNSSINKKDYCNHRAIVSKLVKSSKMKLVKNHQINNNKFNKNVINSIIYNEKEHIVAEFKDFLIYDDFSEFMKRFYKLNESSNRLPKINEFYENYSKIFPNYTNIPEAKYMYKNIKRKQKVIDNNQQRNDESDNEENFKVINTEAYDSIMNQTQKVYEDKILRVDESVQSLEGIIDTIGRAEKNAVLIPDKTISKKIDISQFSKKNDEVISTNYINQTNYNGVTKNTYNFHLDLNKLNTKNMTDRLLNTETKSTSSNKITLNQLDDIQKLQLKVNAGLINSDKNYNIKTLESDNINKKKISLIPLPIEKAEGLDSGNCLNFVKADNPFNKGYVNKIQTIKSARNSKNLEIADLLRQENVNIAKQIRNDKANMNDNIIYEEEIQGKVIDSKLITNKKNKENLKPYHKSTVSMPKLPSNTIYNNYNIINNYQNIILPNESMIPKGNIQKHGNIETDKKAITNVSKINKYVKNYSKDLDKIKQNMKKILNDYNFSANNRSKDKQTNFREVKTARTIERNYPLSARNDIDKDIINMKKLLKENMEDKVETDRVGFTSKKLSEILTDDIINKQTISGSRNCNEKDKNEDNLISGKVSYLTSSINFDNQHARKLSHNNSNININNSKKLSNPEVKNKQERITGKIFHYQDQIIKSQNISPSASKKIFIKKVVTNPTKAIVNANKISAIAKQNTKQVNPLQGSKVMSNYQSNNVNKWNVTNVVGQYPETARKPSDIKKMLNIKNFFEITKINEMKAKTDRNHYQMK